MNDEFVGKWREAFEERAGILEFDAGYPRSVAEGLARREVLNLQNRATSAQNSASYTDV